jgi:hypothetical protein
MKFIKSLLFILFFFVACVLAIVVSHGKGILLFCGLMILAYLLFKRDPFQWSVLFVRLGISTVFCVSAFYFFGLLGADEATHQKVALLKADLIQRGYQPKWIIISEKRNKVYNRLLAHSVDSSEHLMGKAIDLYVFDIDGDGTFDITDIQIFQKSNRRVEKEHPELKGAFGDYFKKKNGYFSKHMIHIDTRGYSVYYPKSRY